MVVHCVNMCTFIEPHMHLHSMLDSNGSAGKVKLMLRALLMMSFIKVTGFLPVQLGKVSPTSPFFPK